MKQKMITISVPCYNEEENVRLMAETLIKIMETLNYRFEIIFTDNCSTDNTQEEIRKIAKEDKRVKAVFNNRNYGVADGRSGQNAGRYYAKDFDALICLPCDFQEPPELIPEFIKYWEQGYKIVCGEKVASKEGKLKYGLRQIFYKLIQGLSDIEYLSNISGIRLLDREVSEQFADIDPEMEFRWAIAEMGYEVKLISYVQQKRRAGKSSYNVTRYFDFALTSMICTTVAPLRLMTIAGSIMSIISFVLAIVYLVMKLVLWYRFEAGVAPVLICVLFFGSVQLLFIGVVGEYIGAILKKVSKKPKVIVKETINLD